MKVKKEIEDVLETLNKELKRVYGPRFKGLVLYGSYARGEERPGSDLDVAMVLDDFDRPWPEIERTGELVSRLSLDLDTTISLVPIREADLKLRKTGFLMRLSEEGVMVG